MSTTCVGYELSKLQTKLPFSVSLCSFSTSRKAEPYLPYPPTIKVKSSLRPK